MGDSPRQAGSRTRTAPLGALIGTVEYHRVITSGEWLSENLEMHDDDDFHFGNYGEGRFAWCSRNPVAFPEPIPFKGRQDVLYALPEPFASEVSRQISLAGR